MSFLINFATLFLFFISLSFGVSADSPSPEPTSAVSPAPGTPINPAPQPTSAVSPVPGTPINPVPQPSFVDSPAPGTPINSTPAVSPSPEPTSAVSPAPGTPINPAPQPSFVDSPAPGTPINSTPAVSPAPGTPINPTPAVSPSLEPTSIVSPSLAPTSAVSPAPQPSFADSPAPGTPINSTPAVSPAPGTPLNTAPQPTSVNSPAPGTLINPTPAVSPSLEPTSAVSPAPGTPINPAPAVSPSLEPTSAVSPAPGTPINPAPAVSPSLEPTSTVSPAPGTPINPAPAVSPSPEPTSAVSPSPEPTSAVSPSPEPTSAVSPAPGTPLNTAPQPTSVNSPAPGILINPTPAVSPSLEPTSAVSPAPQSTSVNSPAPQSTSALEPSSVNSPGPSSVNAPVPAPAPGTTWGKSPAPQPSSVNAPVPEPAPGTTWGKSPEPQPSSVKSPVPEPSSVISPTPQPSPNTHQPAIVPPQKQGTCSIPRSIGTCISLCTTDNDCMLLQKCCSNGCGRTCQDPEKVDCNITECDPVLISISGVLCSDGTTTGPYCQKDAFGKCNWTYRTCPPVIQPKPGTCPTVLDSTIGLCQEVCTDDSECPTTQKCCSNGCGHICKDAVTDCVVAGLRNQVCADPNSVTTLVAKTDPVTKTLSEACLRCVDYATCTRNNENSTCSWSQSFFDCKKNCLNSNLPPTTCIARSACGCFSVPNCGWCLVSTPIITSNGTSPFNWGLCLSSTLSDKCAELSTSGGYSGTYLSTIPDDCAQSGTTPSGVPLELNPINPNLGDGSSLVKNAIIKNVLQQINGGEITEVALQLQLDSQDLDINNVIPVVDKILQATTDGTTGTIHTLVNVNTILTTYETSNLCQILNNCYASILGISSNIMTNCQLMEFTGVTGKKRQTGSATYVHTTILVVTPYTPPSSDYLWVLGPILASVLIISIILAIIFIQYKKQTDNKYVFQTA